MATNGYDVAGSVASSLLDFAGSSVMANSANAKSKRNALTNFWMQNYFMDKQNEYNKPINQMKRLREAGLNPNLVYDKGNAVIASASPSGGSMADVTPANGTFNVLGKMQAINAMKQQDANIKETEARTQAIDDNTRIKEKELALQEKFYKHREKMLDAQIGRYGLQNVKTNAEIERLSRLGVKFSDDPIGWVGSQASRVSGLLEDIHDATLDFLNNKFGYRSNGYIRR